MIISTTILAALGFAASLYIFFVEQKLKSNPQFKPVCDLSDRISCTKPIKSKYSKLLGISNGLAGMFFYALIFVASVAGYTKIVCAFSVIACIASVGLAYLLYFKIHTVCLMCTAIYIINIALLLSSYKTL